MKKLLGIVVLGLGLVFNVNVYAKTLAKNVINIKFCKDLNTSQVYPMMVNQSCGWSTSGSGVA